MMHYVVFARDRAGTQDLRIQYRQAHMDYWKGQGDTVLVAGAMMSSDDENAEPIGSQFLMAAPSAVEVARLIAEDPFSLHGIFDGSPQIQRVRPAIGTLWQG